MTMIGRAFDWFVMAGLNAEKWLREAVEVKVSVEDGKPLDGRLFARWFGESPALRVTWSLGGWNLRAGVVLDESEAEVMVKVAVPGVALWFAVEDRRIARALLGSGERRYELRAHDGSVFWTVGGDGGWKSVDPWWREGSWSYAEALLGDAMVRCDIVGEEARVTAPLPEGSYPVSVTLERVLVHRARFPRLTAEEHRTAKVKLIHSPLGHAPMIPGKGENSYDLDPDCIYEMSLPARSVAEAVGGYVTAVMRDREKRAGRIDWTPPAADPSPAPEAPPTPRSASASPFSPGSLAAGSATEDRILDRRSPYLGSDAN